MGMMTGITIDTSLVHDRRGDGRYARREAYDRRRGPGYRDGSSRGYYDDRRLPPPSRRRHRYDNDDSRRRLPSPRARRRSRSRSADSRFSVTDIFGADGHSVFSQKIDEVLRQNPILSEQIAHEKGCATTFAGTRSALSAVSPPPSGEVDRHSLSLYIGNVPPGASGSSLTLFLNGIAKNVGIGQDHSSTGPILACNISGTFAFAQFHSAGAATAFIQRIQRIPFMGNTLRVGRPSKYSGPPDVVDASLPIDLSALNLPRIDGVDTSKLLAQLEKGIDDQEAKVHSYGNPSSCFVLADIAVEVEGDEEEIEDIELDVKEECANFGSIVGVKWCDGTVLVRMATEDDARKAMDELAGRMFGDALVEPKFCSLEEYEARRRGFKPK